MSAAVSATTTTSDSPAVAVSAAYYGASPAPPRSSHFYRGDAIDIPLIDHHLLTHLLFPRLVSVIQLAFPRVYLDWTTTASTSTSSLSVPNIRQFKTLRWKRIIEGILRTCFIVGSCRRITVRSDTSKQRQQPNHQDHEQVSVITPAMHNLGMRIRPSSSSTTSRCEKNITNNSSGRIYLLQQYAKVGTLILATIIIPTFFKELKLYRKRQLENHDRQLRMEDIRNEEYQLFHSSPSLDRSSTNDDASGRRAIGEVSNTDNPSQHRCHPYNNDSTSNSILQRRALKRQSRIITYLMDTTLGLGEVFLPPLQLVNYILYLWGRSCTPQLGMQLAGWEYCCIDRYHVGHDDDSGGGDRFGERSYYNQQQQQQQQQQRHVNFQYAHRRLLVEEGLRAISMIIPPALPSHLRLENGSGGNNAVENSARTAVGATTGVAAGRHPQHNNINHEVAIVSSQSSGTGSDSTGRTTREDDYTRRKRRNGWTMMRKKISSFMGVVDEEDEINDITATTTTATRTSTSEARRYSLTCSMCHMENPSIPYIASCGHCYCYLCLRMAVTDNLSFRCVDCGRKIVSSARPKPGVFR